MKASCTCVCVGMCGGKGEGWQVVEVIGGRGGGTCMYGGGGMLALCLFTCVCGMCMFVCVCG